MDDSSYIHIIDFSFVDEAQDWLIDLPFDRSSPTTEMKLLRLPEQKEEVCRVYFDRDGAWDNVSLQAHIDSECHYLPLTAPFSSSFSQLLSQCREGRWTSLWWNVNTYAVSPLEYQRGILELTMKEARLYFEKNTKGRMKLFVSIIDGPTNERLYTFSQNRRPPITHHLHSIAEALVNLHNTYRATVLNSMSVTTKNQLVVLCLFHTILQSHSQTVDALDRYVRAYVEGLPNKRPTTDLLQRFTNIAKFCEQVERDTLKMTTTTESLLQVVFPNVPATKPEAHVLGAEVRAICIDLNTMASAVSRRLDCQLKFLELHRNTSEASNLRVISLLASIFLPLTLASSLLSMQTRITSLGFLLYDWVGIAIILGMLSAALVYIIRFLAWLSEEVTSRKSASRIVWLTGLSIALFVMTSFVVGMVKDSTLGLKILGFGAAAFFGVAPLALCVLFFGNRQKRRQQADQ